MHAIAYVSAASWNLLDEQVERIVSESRRLNALNGVTGVLMYCDGNFMQYLEGEEGAVVETMARIRASESHYQINELMNQPIAEREFGDWPMGFFRPGPDAFVELASARWKDMAQAGPGASLLRSFWTSSRSPMP
jgi:FAD-dependent sensor of blue light